MAVTEANRTFEGRLRTNSSPDAITKSTGLTASKGIIFPYRIRVKAVRILVGTAFATNPMTLSISGSGFTTMNSVVPETAGTLSIHTFEYNQVIPANTAMLITQAASAGNGTYWYFIDYEVIENDPTRVS